MISITIVHSYPAHRVPCHAVRPSTLPKTTSNLSAYGKHRTPYINKVNPHLVPLGQVDFLKLTCANIRRIYVKHIQYIQNVYFVCKGVFSVRVTVQATNKEVEI